MLPGKKKITGERARKIAREWESKRKVGKTLRGKIILRRKALSVKFHPKHFLFDSFPIFGVIREQHHFVNTTCECDNISVKHEETLDMSCKFTLIKRHKTCEEMNQGLYVTLTQFSPRKSRQRKEKKNWKMIWKVFYAGNVLKFCQAHLKAVEDSSEPRMTYEEGNLIISWWF